MKKLKANHLVLFNQSKCRSQSNRYHLLLVVEAHRIILMALISGEMTHCHCWSVKLTEGEPTVWLVPACSLFFPVEAPCRNGDQHAADLAGVAGDPPPLQLKNARGMRVVRLRSSLPPRRPGFGSIPGYWGGRRNGLTWLGSAGWKSHPPAPPLRLQSRDRIAASEHDPSTSCFPRPPRPLLYLRQYDNQIFNI